MRWQLATADDQAVSVLARQLNVPLLLARLLVLRGMEAPEAAAAFLNPNLR